MADGWYGSREIVIDLNDASAREIKKTPELVAIKKIRISGATGAGVGHIVLREDSGSGDVKFRQVTAATTTYTIEAEFPTPMQLRGLYMDALGTAWAAPATMILYCA
jgi:hypothetical protein